MGDPKPRVYVCHNSRFIVELSDAAGSNWAFTTSTDPFDAIVGIAGERPQGEGLLVVITGSSRLLGRQKSKEFYAPGVVEAAARANVVTIFVAGDALDETEVDRIAAVAGRKDLRFFSYDDLPGLVSDVAEVLAAHGVITDPQPESEGSD